MHTKGSLPSDVLEYWTFLNLFIFALFTRFNDVKNVIFVRDLQFGGVIFLAA